MFAHSFLVFNNRLLREAVGGTADPSWLVVLMVALYAGILVVLSFYGGHRYMMILNWLRARRRRAAGPAPLSDHLLPAVTIQLPLYNELYVIDRLLDAVGRLDYPKDRLEVQVLDDSTDESRLVAQEAVLRLRKVGLDVRYIHRQDRTGFKAGALANGLRQAKHGLVAILDADFCPGPEFLRRVVAHFDDPKVGMVQGRWGHLNEEACLLTRVQALMLNGHFLVEHPARHGNRLFFNFNGTAGVWRRAAIEDAGGWQHDTLTEDLDLSYRAQLKGWRFVYDPSIVCPAELPVEMNAFKNQQHRWAKGSIQVMRKILPAVLRSPQPLRVKLESFFHLTGNLVYPLMFVMCLLTVPMLVLRARIADGTFGAALDLGIFLCATASVASFYTLALVVSGGPWWRRLHLVPMMLSLGIGLAVNQAKAVWEALRGQQSAFVRTPKFNMDARSARDSWLAKRYRGGRGVVTLFELAFALYFTYAVGFAVFESLWGSLPFLLLFFTGFWYVCLLSLLQGRAPRTAGAGLPAPRTAAS